MAPPFTGPSLTLDDSATSSLTPLAGNTVTTFLEITDHVPLKFSVRRPLLADVVLDLEDPTRAHSAEDVRDVTRNLT